MIVMDPSLPGTGILSAYIGCGNFSIRDSPRRAASVSVDPGATIQLRARAPETSSATTEAVLTVGTVSTSFRVESADWTPNAFSIPSVTGAPLDQGVNSDPVTLAGIDPGTPLTIENGSYNLNGSGWTSAKTNVGPGDTVRVRKRAADTSQTTVEAILTVGTVSKAFRVTSADWTPDSLTVASNGPWLAYNLILGL